MFTNIFPTVLDMSFTATIVISLVLILRLLFKKAPTSITYLLWFAVFFRLLCPFSVESVISVIPSQASNISSVVYFEDFSNRNFDASDESFSFNQNKENVNSNTVAQDGVNETTTFEITTENNGLNLLEILSIVWFFGVFTLFSYTIFSIIKLRRKLKNSQLQKENIYTMKGIQTAFVVGFFNPKIYLPQGLSEREQEYILLHEKTHLKRFDHFTRLVCYFALCLHWFNPFVWVAFYFSENDMEKACDEQVMQTLGKSIKKDYAHSLLTLATKRTTFLATPLTFAEGNIKGRIKNILSYKNPHLLLKIVIGIISIFAILILITNPITNSFNENTNENSVGIEVNHLKISSYADIRGFSDNWVGEEKYIFEEGEFHPSDIKTYTFNEYTVLGGSEDLMAEILEDGKNPAMGVSELHEQGITGKGVNIGIINQNLLLDHPEFAGKIVAYYDTGCETPDDFGSMHGPATTSLLVGETIGVAPDANVYYAAVPSWLGDTEYYAKALYWIIEENKKLPANEKIPVVVVPASPSGENSAFTKNTHMWEEAVLAANKEGILVLDCREYEDTNIFTSAILTGDDKENPYDYSLEIKADETALEEDLIGVPTAEKTVAEHYNAGEPSYFYSASFGKGLSLTYGAGVLALGWQINPNLSYEEMLEILFETCATDKAGYKIINPTAFIKGVTP